MDDILLFDIYHGLSLYLEPVNIGRIPGSWAERSIYRIQPPAEYEFYAAVQRTNGTVMPVYRSRISGRLAFGSPPGGLS